MLKSAKTTLPTEDNQKALQSLTDDGIISETSLEAINNIKDKEIRKNTIQRLGQFPHIHTRDDGRVFTRIKVSGQWRRFAASSDLELYKKLYDFIPVEDGQTPFK